MNKNEYFSVNIKSNNISFCVPVTWKLNNETDSIISFSCDSSEKDTIVIMSDRIPDIMKNKGSRMRFTNGDTPYFTYYFKNEEIKSTEDYMDSISAIVEEIKGLREGEEQ